MKEKQIRVIEKTSLFEGYARQELLELLSRMKAETKKLESGETLWSMGEKISRACLVLEGKLEAVQYGAAGTAHLAAVLTEGSLAGEVLMAADARESPVEIHAVTTAAVLLFSMDGLFQCGEAGTKMLRRLLRGISEKYWALQERVRLLSVPNGLSRIALFLIDSSEKSPNKLCFHLNMSREQMAAYLGMNRSALSRLLGDMKRAGLIDFRRGAFQITDYERLARLSDN